MAIRHSLMKTVVLALALEVIASIAYGQIADPQTFKETRPTSARHCPDDDAFSPERPGSDSGPTQVGVGVYLSDIIALDDVRQSMQLDAYSIFRWLDPRLADSLRGDLAP